MPCNKSSVRALLGEGRVEVLEWGHEGEIEADTQTDRRGEEKEGKRCIEKENPQHTRSQSQAPLSLQLAQVYL